MSLFEVGRLCLKIAGRDAGRTGVVVEKIDDGVVLIDGGTRRKKVNVKHLEPLDQIIELGEQASHEEVAEKFRKLRLPIWETKAKQAGPRPARKRKSQKVAPVVEAPVDKKAGEKI